MSHAQPFIPGTVDYDGHMSAGYRAGRALSVEAGRIWCEILAPHLPAGGDNRVLDLGAGTGRFATLFARTFEGQIVGVEPSRGMLAEAIQDVRPRNLMYVAGSAERIPLANHSCDVAWLSQIWHHVRDHQAGARELRRVLRPGGVLLLRGTFGDQLDGFPTLFRFWPGHLQGTPVASRDEGSLPSERLRPDRAPACVASDVRESARIRRANSPASR